MSGPDICGGTAVTQQEWQVKHGLDDEDMGRVIAALRPLNRTDGVQAFAGTIISVKDRPVGGDLLVDHGVMCAGSEKGIQRF